MHTNENKKKDERMLPQLLLLQNSTKHAVRLGPFVTALVLLVVTLGLQLGHLLTNIHCSTTTSGASYLPKISNNEGTPPYVTNEAVAVPTDVCSRARASKSSIALYQWEAQCDALDWTATQTMQRTDGNLTLATVVPAIKANAEILLRLMESIQKETVPPDEVIIAMSDVGKDENNTFCQNLLQDVTRVYTKSPVKLICIGARILASRARNLGSMSSTTEILSMMDADDVEYPIRNEVSKNVFECHGRRIRVFLHSFSRRLKEIPPAIPDGHQCAEDEQGLEKLYGDDLYDILDHSHKRLWLHKTMTHGWPVVHRSVFARGLRYSSLNHGEDCVFIRDILYTFGRHKDTAVFLNRPLGFYLKASETYRANFEK